MTGVSISIVSCAEDSLPAIVNCELTDAHGTTHRFVEKAPIVTTENLSTDSSYPQTGFLACEVIDSTADPSHPSILKIDTSRPWGVESTTGLTQFEVASEDVLTSD